MSFFQKKNTVKNSGKERTVSNGLSFPTSSMQIDKSLSSTQQIRLDWSKFENHTFFNSAVFEVNEAFDKIINFFPISGDEKEIREFEDSLTGFEKWVYDQFPKNKGYINFSGSATGETQTNGTYIEIKDSEGFLYKDISKRYTGRKVLDPVDNNFSISAWIHVPQIANDNQIILQKRSSLSNNFTIALSSSASTGSADIVFGITSGSYFTFVSSSIQKGEFTDLCFVYDQERTYIYNQREVLTSSANSSIRCDYLGASLLVGSGDNARINESIFYPMQSFSGSIDDLKFYHKKLEWKEWKDNTTRNSKPDNNLKLWMRFNEPSGSYQYKNVAFDSSFSSLHSNIQNYIAGYTRSTGSISNPMINENESIILFPDYPEVNDLNYDLIFTGSLYDDINPNLITRLIPEHYFIDTSYDFLENTFDTFGKLPGVTRMPNVEIVLKILFVWAKFFDQLKIFIDSFTHRGVFYNDYNTVPDIFLKNTAKRIGISLPDLFTNGDFDQIYGGINVSSSKTSPLKSIQDEIWRRILSSASDIRSSRGTLESIKSVFRGAGIDPSVFDYREFGSEIKTMKNFEKRPFAISLLNFSGSNDAIRSSIDSQRYWQGYPRAKSEYLSLDRSQKLGGPSLSGISANDNLLTSGSFTISAQYRLTSDNPQSLMRLSITGSLSSSISQHEIANIVSTPGYINLALRETSTGSLKNLILSGVNIHNSSSVWNVSWGIRDSHDISAPGRHEIFLRAGKYDGSNVSYYSTSSVFNSETGSILKSVDSLNASGAFLSVGLQDISSASHAGFLNDSSISSVFHTSSFTGGITNIRFWTKYQKLNSWIDGLRSFSLIAHENIDSWNHSFESGSFERCVLETKSIQNTTSSSTGELRLFDFSHNNLHLNCYDFERNKNLFDKYWAIGDVNVFSNSESQKIIVRSFQEQKNLTDQSDIAPVYSPRWENRKNSRVFSLEWNSSKSINTEISSVFSSDSIEASLAPVSLIHSRYSQLDHASKMIENEIVEKQDIIAFKHVFKWLDSSFEKTVANLVPFNTKFLGINFVYESSVLERQKYKWSDSPWIREGEE